jgi:hypothetical protein
MHHPSCKGPCDVNKFRGETQVPYSADSPRVSSILTCTSRYGPLPSKPALGKKSLHLSIELVYQNSWRCRADRTESTKCQSQKSLNRAGNDETEQSAALTSSAAPVAMISR